MQVVQFKEDCDILLNAFGLHKKTDFVLFCNEWKRLNFHYIFFGFRTIHDIVQFVDASMPTVKHLFINANNLFERLGAFYLLYAFYFKQPSKEFIKIRVTHEEWNAFKSFYEEISINSDYAQAKLIFWKLLENDTFRFVADEHEYGFESFMSNKDKSRQEETHHNFKSFEYEIQRDLSTLLDPNKGIVTALNILEIGYNEMKETLESSKSEISKGKLLPPTNLVATIKDTFNKIEEIFIKDIKRSKNSSINSNKNDTDSNEDSGDSSPDDPDWGVKRANIKEKAFQKMTEKKPVKLKKKIQNEIIKTQTDFIQIERPSTQSHVYTKRRRERLTNHSLPLKMVKIEENDNDSDLENENIELDTVGPSTSSHHLDIIS